MAAVGAHEARARLPELLRRVSCGERIVITEQGVPIAALVPIETAPTRPVSEVVAALRAFRQGRRLGSVSVRELIDEGRE